MADQISRQFYTLSKSHHPDLHPNDPDASKRFVRISEAYATLSAPTKRAPYDRDYARAFQQAAQQPEYPSGSFSSAAANSPGGRPASGLSRRRTQYRGPPPSFYQAGGWGAQGAKRAEHAARPSHAWEKADAANGDKSSRDDTGDMPGMGPGGFAHGLDDDVPHFDSRGHYQTHSTIERTRHKARRRVVRVTDDGSSSDSSSIILAFFTVSGVLLLGMSLGGGFSTPANKATPSAVEGRGGTGSTG